MKKLLLLTASALLLASCGASASPFSSSSLAGTSSAFSSLPSGTSSVQESSKGEDVSSKEITSEDISESEPTVSSTEEQVTSVEELSSIEELTSQEEGVSSEGIVISEEESSQESIDPDLPDDYVVPSNITAYAYQGGTRLDTDDRSDGISLSVSSETGQVRLLDDEGESLLEKFNDEGMSAGMIKMENEYVVSVNGAGEYTLTHGTLKISEQDGFHLVRYAVGSLSRYYLFKDGESLQINIRIAGSSFDLNYGMQRIVYVENHGWAYVHNLQICLNMELYRDNRVTLQMDEDGYYELRKEGVETMYFYYVNDILFRSSVERGTYTCQNKPDLVLDGFGHYALGEKQGIYVWQRSADNSLYVYEPKDGDIEYGVDPCTLYYLDLEAMTYRVHETPEQGEPSPIEKGSYFEGMTLYVDGGTSYVLEIHISFSSFVDNRISEFIYSLRLPSQTYAATKVNLGSFDYTYSDGVISFSDWSFSVNSKADKLTLQNNPLGFDSASNTLTLSADLGDEW